VTEIGEGLGRASSYDPSSRPFSATKNIFGKIKPLGVTGCAQNSFHGTIRIAQARSLLLAKLAAARERR
jgi:hypothetical protein